MAKEAFPPSLLCPFLEKRGQVKEGRGLTRNESEGVVEHLPDVRLHSRNRRWVHWVSGSVCVYDEEKKKSHNNWNRESLIQRCIKYKSGLE